MILAMTNTPNASNSAQAWTVGRLITTAADYLKAKNVDEPRLAAEILLAHAMQCTRLQIYTRWTDVIADEARSEFREFTRRAAGGEPPAYIVGHKEFFSMDFEVNPAVLIPRPETELLVERVITYVRENPRSEWQIFEPGTGSGNIGAAILKAVPSAHLVAGDISEESIAVARRNYEKHGLADRATVAVIDWMQLPAELMPPGGFDMIVTNPPYVGTAETDMVHPSVLANEPPAALFGGADGLDFYRRTPQEALPLLKTDGTLFCEVGWGESDKVIEIFQQAGWRSVGRWKDLAGIERTLQFAPRKMTSGQRGGKCETSGNRVGGMSLAAAGPCSSGSG